MSFQKGKYLLLGCVALTACGEVEDSKHPIPICPQVAIVRELGMMIDSGKIKLDTSAFHARAEMTGVAGDCTYQKDGIDVYFSLKMKALRGDLTSGGAVRFPYFAAVVGPDGAILNKEKMTVTFSLDGAKRSVEQEEALHVFIPLSKDLRSTGPAYRVLLGYQLPSAE